MSMYDRDWYRERKIDYDNGGLISAGNKPKFIWKVIGIITIVVAVAYFLYSAS